MVLMRLNKNTNKAVWSCLAAFIMCAATVIWMSQEALAVRVSLKRIIFEGSKRSEILTLINSTSEPETYRLEWQRFRMGDGDEALKLVKEGEDISKIKFADDMIRFAPRRVTVPPGGSQQVRLLLRRPKNLEQGEYRAHLRILKEAAPQPYGEAPADRPAVVLAVQPAISLPVFVRYGDLSAQVSINQTKLEKIEKGLNVSFRLNRQGERSVYGDLDFTCQDGGEEKILHTVRGIAVYTETSYRDLNYNLLISDSSASNCSAVNIVYRSDNEDKQFKGQVLAQATASL